MTIENKISTIKKAVVAAAEKIALKESMPSPKQEHYERVFELYRQLKNINPNALENLIVVSAKAKELKNETGENLYSLFETEWENEELNLKNKLVKKITAIEKQDLTTEKYKQEIMVETNKLFDEISKLIENNSKIQEAFSGKKNLLQKNIEFKKSTLSNLLMNLEAE